MQNDGTYSLQFHIVDTYDYENKPGGMVQKVANVAADAQAKGVIIPFNILIEFDMDED